MLALGGCSLVHRGAMRSFAPNCQVSCVVDGGACNPATNGRCSVIAATAEGQARMRRLHRIGSLRAVSRGRRAIVLGLAGAFLALGVQSASAAHSASWSMSGQGITNWRYQPDESKINQGNVKSQLALQWATALGGDISATPAVVDGVAYVPDWGGYLSAVDTATGNVIWQKSVSTLADAAGPMVVDNTGTAVLGTGPVVSRTSPAVSGDAVVIGTQAMMSAASGVERGHSSSPSTRVTATFCGATSSTTIRCRSTQRPRRSTTASSTSASPPSKRTASTAALPSTPATSAGARTR